MSLQTNCRYCQAKFLEKEYPYQEYYCNKCKEIRRNIFNNTMPEHETKKDFLIKVKYMAPEKQDDHHTILHDYVSYYAVHKDFTNEDIDMFGKIDVASCNRRFLYEKEGYTISSMKIVHIKNIIDFDKHTSN